MQVGVSGGVLSKSREGRRSLPANRYLQLPLPTHSLVKMEPLPCGGGHCSLGAEMLREAEGLSWVLGVRVRSPEGRDEATFGMREVA